MSEDRAKAVTIKRTAKKKSGYTVEKSGDGYYISDAPGKARVNVGDKVVAINGIQSDEFIDEDDANDLIESIRIVVVPEAELDDYDAEKEAEEAEMEDEEDEEEAEEPPQKGKKGKAASAPKSPKKDMGPPRRLL